MMSWQMECLLALALVSLIVMWPHCRREGSGLDRSSVVVEMVIVTFSQPVSNGVRDAIKGTGG